MFMFIVQCALFVRFFSLHHFLLFTKTEFIVLHFFSFLFYISKKEQKKAIKKRNSKQNGNEEEFLSVSFKFRLYIFSFDRHKSHHSFFTSFFLSFFFVWEEQTKELTKWQSKNGRMENSQYRISCSENKMTMNLIAQAVWSFKKNFFQSIFKDFEFQRTKNE